MQNSSAKRRAFAGPILFSHGFRPFFLGAGLWAAFALIVWIVMLASGTDIPSRLVGPDWHMHEMVFGFTTAVIAGFLLTAVPNWTGRLPVAGWPVAALSGVWVLGRVALFFSALLPRYSGAAIDSAFLVLLGIIIGREIFSGKNWRNLKVLVVVAVLGIANMVFHYETSIGTAFTGYGIRLAIAAILTLISLIGGRVIPSFTRNWMVRNAPQNLPTPPNRFDAATLIVSGVTLALWVALPQFALIRILALLAGVLHLLRLARWSGWRTISEPIVTILHVAYLFIPVGFLMLAAGELLPGWRDAYQIPHAWMVGAVGGMTLAMMTRVSLGHSGRAMRSTRGIVVLYILWLLAVLFRIASEIYPGASILLDISALGWIGAFGGFAILYYPVLARPRLQPPAL